MTANRLDPASEWALGLGRDFDITRTEPAAQGLDHLVGIRAHADPAPTPVPPWNRYTVLLPPDPTPLAAGLAAPALRVFPAALPARAIPAGTPAAEPAWTAPPGVTPERVVVLAVIDNAINVLHDRLTTRDGDGARKARVDFAWRQDCAAGGAVPFGREWTREALDAILAATGDDEDLALRALGTEFGAARAWVLAQRHGHGTHVADVAAGAAAADADPDVRLLTVELPRLIAEDTSAQQYGAFVISAVEYICARATLIGAALGVPVPLVVNFSYGMSAGPHDGSHVVEAAVETLLAEYTAATGARALSVLPTGNQTLDRGAAWLAADAAGAHTLTLPWRMPPGDTTSSYLEAFIPAGASVDVTLTLPDGTVHALGDLSSPFVLSRPRPGAPSDDTAIVRATLDVPWAWTGAPGGRRRLLVCAAPTAPLPTHRSGAHPGLWTVAITATLKAGERIEAWVQRDDNPLGARPDGRQQSFLDHPDYQRFAPSGRVLDTDPATPCPVRRAGACNALATAASTVRVGAHTLGPTLRVSPYSGTAAGTMPQPLVSAPADRSPVRRSVLVAGVKSGSTVALDGTSLAAPQVARRLVAALQATPPATREAFSPAAALAALVIAGTAFDPARAGLGPLPPSDEQHRRQLKD